MQGHDKEELDNQRRRSIWTAVLIVLFIVTVVAINVFKIVSNGP